MYSNDHFNVKRDILYLFVVSCRGELGEVELPSDEPAPGDAPLVARLCLLEEPNGYRREEVPFCPLSGLASNGGG